MCLLAYRRPGIVQVRVGERFASLIRKPYIEVSERYQF